MKVTFLMVAKNTFSLLFFSKDKEVHYSSSVPRILSIDTYFVNEVEKVEKDPHTGWVGEGGKVFVIAFYGFRSSVDKESGGV